MSMTMHHSIVVKTTPCQKMRRCVSSPRELISQPTSDGEVMASGRLTSDGVSTLMKELDGETFEGTGIFEGVGTLNGTGLFIGPGTFSGDIVNPVLLSNWTRSGCLQHDCVDAKRSRNSLPDPVEVGIEPSFDLAMTRTSLVVCRSTDHNVR